MTKVTLLAVAIVALLHCQNSGAKSISDINLEHAITFSETTLNRSERLETSIADHGTVLLNRGPGFKEYLNYYPNNNATALGVKALINVAASEYISNQRIDQCGRYNPQDCAKYLSSISLGNTTLGVLCKKDQQVSCDLQAKYRTYTGECNNVKDPSLGKANSAYGRAVFPQYLRGFDGIKPDLNDYGIGLPNVRHLSVALSTPSGEIEQSTTLAVMQWAEFIANDLSFTGTRKMVFKDEPIVCCDPAGRHLAPRYVHPFCVPINVTSDRIYSEKCMTCLNYVRSVPAFNHKCTFGPMEQMNQASHFLDGSMIYGSSEEKANSLRTFKNGKLIVSTKNGYDYLPQSNSQYKTECAGNCYESGDDRVNNYPQLAALHTLWVREHNRITPLLLRLNPSWSDEELYQEARRIVIAKIQKITYSDFLPILLGPNKANEINNGSYNADESPEVLNEVATAALRFITSLMQQELSLKDENRVEKKKLRLSDTYFKPHIIEEEDNLDLIIRALATQPNQKMDLGVVPDLTSKLYVASSDDIGLDIFSFDILRGRDHGLPGYNAFRRYCGLRVARNFNELTNIKPTLIARLRQVYRDVNDIDLLVGAFAENRAEGIVGETLSCLLSKQFAKTRVGDRYFYTNQQQPHPFMTHRLELLKGTKLAQIFCANSNKLSEMQRNVFIKPGTGNNVVPCKRAKPPATPT